MPFLVEQAIFTSIRGERLDGYQLTSRSGGIDDELASELSTWGPAHDSLESRLGRSSVNFHPIDDRAAGEERVCLSYTQIAGAEYSGRSGGRVYTHSFVLLREALLPFQGNPFLILRAFRSAGRTQPRRQPPAELDSFLLVGRASCAARTNQPPLQSALDEECCEKLLWALAAGQPVYLSSDEPLDGAAEAVLQLLPPEDRASVSFATALRISPRRPFQLQGVPVDQVQLRQLQRNENAVVIQLPSRNGSPTRDTKSAGKTR
jgi:hypothetical protein